jgi:hypothetical protein
MTTTMEHQQVTSSIVDLGWIVATRTPDHLRIWNGDGERAAVEVTSSALQKRGK